MILLSLKGVGIVVVYPRRCLGLLVLVFQADTGNIPLPTGVPSIATEEVVVFGPFFLVLIAVNFWM